VVNSETEQKEEGRQLGEKCLPFLLPRETFFAMDVTDPLAFEIIERYQQKLQLVNVPSFR